MNKLYCLVLVWCLGISANALAQPAPPLPENADYTVAVLVWGNSDTPLAQEIADRIRLLGFNVPDPTMHKGSRYCNYTDRVEVRYTTRGQAKLSIILQELEKIPGLAVESKLFTAPEDQTFSLAGDIQIQFPVILP
jgi:hypothetical protein